MGAYTKIEDYLVCRTFDVAAVNRVVNDPTVFPHLALGAFDYIDMSPLIENPRNICFMGELGGAILVWSAPDTYDAHDFILPDGRGKWAKIVCASILSMMFDAYGAKMIWAQTPVENRACRMFNRMLGFKSRGTEEAILVPGSAPREVEIFVMERAH